MKHHPAKRIVALILLAALNLALFVPSGITVTEAKEPSHTIVIASSDFQADTDALSASQLAEILAAIKQDYPTADGYLHCGDYTVILQYIASQSESGMAALLDTIDAANMGIPEDAIVLDQGNHDPVDTNGLSPFGNNDPESGKYGVFVIKEDNYMWFAGYQGNNGTENVSLHEATVQATAQSLSEYLHAKAEEGFSAPIFVLSHVPLHYCMRTYMYGDSRYAHYLTDVLNEGAALGLNIVFMFGHNHSQGWDNYLGASCIYLPKGSTMKIADADTKTNCTDIKIGFTYMNAGYTGYYHTDFGEDVDDTLTVSVFDITENSVEIRRYSKDGVHDLKSKGVRNLKVFNGNSESSVGLYEPNTTVISSPQTLHLITEAHAMDRATCTKDGTLPYYYFASTGKYYADIYMIQPVDPSQMTESALGHRFINGVCRRCQLELEEIGDTASSCTVNGTFHCYHDPESDVYYADDRGKTVLSPESILRPLAEHTLDDDGKCTVCEQQIIPPPNPSDPLDVGGFKKGSDDPADWIAPAFSGKRFAGWFADDSYSETFNGTDGTATPKFVDEKIMTVRAQASKNDNSVRFLSTIDASLGYQSVGFSIEVNDQGFNWSVRKPLSHVYLSVIAAGETKTPSQISGSDESGYITFCKLTGIPEMTDVKVTVTAFWITPDGTTVWGEPRDLYFTCKAGAVSIADEAHAHGITVSETDPETDPGNELVWGVE